NDDLFDIARSYAAGASDMAIGDLVPTGEYAPQIITSAVTGERREIYVNVPNLRPDGTLLVPELQAGGVVEVPATCDGLGVHPRSGDPIPPGCAAINRRYLDVCELA